MYKYMVYATVIPKILRFRALNPLVRKFWDGNVLLTHFFYMSSKGQKLYAMGRSQNAMVGYWSLANCGECKCLHPLR